MSTLLMTGAPAVAPTALTQDGHLGLGEAIVFGVVALVTVACGIGVLTAKRAVNAAINMIGIMISLAVLYIVNESPFMGITQVVVYTGAVMTLVLFVIMLVGAIIGSAIPLPKFLQPEDGSLAKPSEKANEGDGGETGRENRHLVAPDALIPLQPPSVQSDPRSADPTTRADACTRSAWLERAPSTKKGRSLRKLRPTSLQRGERGLTIRCGNEPL